MGSLKPVITVWADESGKLQSGQSEWSFKGGANGLAHREGGYPMLLDGAILRIALSFVDARGQPYREVIVSLVVDGSITPNLIKKQDSKKTAVQNITPKHRVQVGSVINFMTCTNTDAKSSVVALLIELDL